MTKSRRFGIVLLDSVWYSCTRTHARRWRMQKCVICKSVNSSWNLLWVSNTLKQSGLWKSFHSECIDFKSINLVLNSFSRFPKTNLYFTRRLGESLSSKTGKWYSSLWSSWYIHYVLIWFMKAVRRSIMVVIKSFLPCKCVLKSFRYNVKCVKKAKLQIHPVLFRQFRKF